MADRASRRQARRNGWRQIRAPLSGAEPEMVADVVRAVLATMSGDLSAQETSLLAEVEALGRTIACAKAEIAALRVDDITDNHIPFATDELDAIVEHTADRDERDSGELRNARQRGRAASSGEPAAKLQDATTRIYEACSFQDITGQRITKVVATLKTIEAKVTYIVTTFGSSPSGEDDGRAGEASEEALLNGPQHPAVAMDQSDIDRLLASFE